MILCWLVNLPDTKKLKYPLVFWPTGIQYLSNWHHSEMRDKTLTNFKKLNDDEEGKKYEMKKKNEQTKVHVGLKKV